MIEKLIEENKNLIYSLMKYFPNYKDKDDLYQAGCLGIIKAYKNYTQNRGTKFSTYSYIYILGEMKKIVRGDKPYKINNEISRLNYKILKVKDILTQKYMREPTTKQIADFLKMDEFLVSEAINSTNIAFSLDSSITENEKSLSEIIDSGSLDLNTLIALKEELNKLSIDERMIITNSNGLTQTELAKNLGMTQVQVSRKSKLIKTKIRENLSI